MNAHRLPRSLSSTPAARLVPTRPSTAVAWLPHRDGEAHDEHERITLADLAQRIARLKGLPCVGRLEAAGARAAQTAVAGPIYLVAPDTLLADEACKLGVSCRDDLFGGVVTHRMHATKAIVHGLVDDVLVVPSAWRDGLAQRLSGVVLPGYSTFSKRDARVATARLLARGRVRIKSCAGVGGHGQWTVDSRHGVDAVLDGLSDVALGRDGLVCELDLARSLTFSVGQADLGARRISYCGLQRQTPDRHGAPVYGGSDLLIVRGDFEDLLRLDLPPAVRLAIRQARFFDGAVGAWLPDLIVSRNNYDVIQGVDRDGRLRSAVLEQSWRPGGASPAEITAMEHFDRHPQDSVLRVATVEVHGTAQPPAAARVHYHADDPRRGPMLKYTLIETGENPTRLFHDCR